MAGPADCAYIDRNRNRVRLVCFLASVACGLAALLFVVVAFAYAKEPISKAEEENYAKVGVRFIRHHEPFLSGEYGNGEPEPEFVLPAGVYVYAYIEGNIPIADNEHCRIKDDGKGERNCEGGPLGVPGFSFVCHTDVNTFFGGEEFEKKICWAYRPIEGEEEGELLGLSNPGIPSLEGCFAGRPVNCATGNQVVTQTDLSVGGHGPPLQLTLTYNSRLAVKQAAAGQFGFGWTGSYSAYLQLKNEGKEATVHQDNGSTVTFARSEESWSAPSGLVQATLANEGSGYVYTLPDQTKMRFSASGRLTGEEDRHGNVITLAYNAENRLESATDGAKRKLTFKYNGSGQVESVEDPMGHVARYGYDGAGNLASVTLPGEGKARWQYGYDSEHELTSETDGRGHAVTTKYASHQAVFQSDAMSRERTWKYATSEPEETTISEPDGSTTIEQFNEFGSPTSVTRAAGTSLAATTSYERNSGDALLGMIDANGHKTEYGYDGEGNRTSMSDANKNESKWTFNSTHDVISATTPKGETTTIKRDSRGNAEAIERPTPGGTQITNYTYDEYGDVKTVEDPLKRTRKYQYDSYGDRTSETDPEGDKRTWSYNPDSQEIAATSPRGNATGAELAKYTTTVERDARGRALSVIEPLSELSHETSIFPEKIEGSFKEPNAVAVDAEGNIWVADSGHDRVLEFNKERKYLGQFGSEGTGEEQFRGIKGIAVDSEGDVFATDYGNDRVQEWRATSEEHFTHVRNFGSPGTTLGHFVEPTGIAIDSAGKIWVRNSLGLKLQEWARQTNGEYTAEGGFGEAKAVGGGPTGLAASNGKLYVPGWGPSGVLVYTDSTTEHKEPVELDQKPGTGEGEADMPSGIAVDPTTGNLYVTEVGTNRVQEFKESGAFVIAFGSAGSGNGQLSGPLGVAIASSGQIYVADTANNRIEEWAAPKGAGEPPTFTTSIFPEKIEGSFKEPNAVAVDAEGNIWVADSGHDRVLEFNKERKYLGQFGSEGTGEEQFRGIKGIAVDSEGDVFATDYGNDRVQEWRATSEEHFTHVRNFGSPGTTLGHFVEPTGIAIDSAGKIWVRNSLGLKLQEWARQTNGEYTAEGGFGEAKAVGGGPTGLAASNGKLYVPGWGPSGVLVYTDSTTEHKEPVELDQKPGTGEGEADMPSGIAVDPTTGNLYVTEVGTNRVQEFKESGAFVIAFGSAGSGNGQLSGPLGVAIASSGQIYVADTANNRIEEWAAPSRVTKYTYDANGNLETQTDPNGHTTRYTYDADNELEKVTQSNGTVTETGYDGGGQVISETDGNKHKTEYKRNVLEEVTEVIDPLKRTTMKEYDPAGNLTSVVDALKRNTTYSYDAGNRLKEVSYSDKTTPTVKYEYDEDGNRKKIIDGTGTTTYKYDLLDRLEESTDERTGGPTESVGYEYDLANQQKKITYPNKKSVTREYDNAGRLKSLTDWLGHTTSFSYDPDSDLKTTTFPSEASNVDEYAYNNVDQMSAVKMTKGAETLASLAYTRDGDGQITNASAKGLPGEPTIAYEYDQNNRLAKVGASAYEYDAANNATKISGSTNTYDSASELEAGTRAKYTYDELAERTKTSPTSGPATTYGYDQAGNLTSVTRPEQGATAAINDSYAYNGDGLRSSQTIAGSTGYLTWDVSRQLPMIVNDGTNSYIYGPGGTPVEQISSAGTVRYLHHDQAGSTRVITAEKGEVEGSYTFDAYGNQTGHSGTASTRLGYDGQYTNSDTGLQYVRARSYDPSTGQFISADPIAPLTREPYAFAGDSPLMYTDPLGLDFLGELEEAGGGALEVANTPIDLAAEGISEAASLTGVPEAAERAAQFWAGLATSQCSSGGERLLGNILGPFAELATRNNIGQTTLALLPGAGYWEAERLGYTTGREFTITEDLRISPFGNSEADNWPARWPHYHRRITDEFGNPVPGGSLNKWHRPWQKGF